MAISTTAMDRHRNLPRKINKSEDQKLQKINIFLTLNETLTCWNAVTYEVHGLIVRAVCYIRSREALLDQLVVAQKHGPKAEHFRPAGRNNKDLDIEKKLQESRIRE